MQTIDYQGDVEHITPVGGNILVRQLDPEMATPGGLALPENISADGMVRAIVLAKGKGHWQAGQWKQMDIDIGDEVWFERGKIGNDTVTCEFRCNGEELLLIEHDIVKALIPAKYVTSNLTPAAELS